MCPHQRNRNPVCRKCSQRSPALYRATGEEKVGCRFSVGPLLNTCPHSALTPASIMWEGFCWVTLYWGVSF